ncbi:hypothetical protein TWF225_010848 [Orbilia oligospora]|nr:hypothetical protein TWF225_010848 [Orbilia oligospora]KAF3252512.1 hypothetical protein TWF217_007708 [Orbilia oligospora]KAF3271440.1 hypothetical protein TWF128_000038 [Orbilia oligospora]KAF3292638.1 hypothetical protein TWF132_005353 [Orbilia oligospora]
MANAPVDTSPDRTSKKRKISENSEPELEIDVSLPEPPSKKDLRKLKKLKSKGVDTDALASLNVPLIDRSKKGAQEGESPANGANSKRSPYGVWIGNLTFNTTREELIEFFTRGSKENDNDDDSKKERDASEVIGTGIRQKDITRLNIPKSTKFKNQNKGFAYVDFLTAGCISHALKLSEKLFNGRKVLIKASTDFNGRPEEDKNKKKGEHGSINSGTNPPCRSIFVGNLGYEVTEQEIFRHFSPAGKIKKVRFMTFEDSGKCKGFSWVDFEELKSAENVFSGKIEGAEDSGDEKEEEDNKNDSESGSESDSEEQPKKKRKTMKKQKKRKTNPYAFMGNRRLRLEYGEDSTTRYKKRFGDGKADTDGKSEKPNSSHKKTSKDAPVRKETSREPKRELTTEEKQAKTVESRLTGRIVEGTGKKITFD